MLKIKFDRDASSWIKNNYEANILYLRIQETYINDLFKARGYMYKNTIYEILGVKWNPKWKNRCRIYKGRAICFKPRKVTDEEIELNIEF